MTVRLHRALVVKRALQDQTSRCPAYTGCERLRGSIRASFEAVGLRGPRPEGGPGCRFTVTPSSDWADALRWSARSRAGSRSGLQPVASTFPPRPLIAGGAAGVTPTRSRDVRSPASPTAPVDHSALRASSRPSCRSGSARAGGRPAGDQGSSPQRPGSRTRPSGRCSSERASRGRQEPCVSRPTATSGPAPVTCCTWTPASTPASSDPATASPAIAAHKTATTETASTSCTRSSTTTPASPMRRSTRTSAPPPQSASSDAPLPSTSDTASAESG